MRQIYFLFLFLILCSFFVCAQQGLRIEILSKPSTHQQDTLYIAGSFNNWNPALSLYRFQKDEKGNEYIVLKGLQAGVTEFKITRGGWNKTESSATGTAISNRIIQFKNDTTVVISIAGWVDDFPSRPPVSTKSKQVFIVDTAFFMPQLQRTRRVWIYLPESYALTQKRYPVMYMQDGQNLFDALTAPYGEWGVDEMMDSLRDGKQSIIVGIDHGGSARLTEYNPFDSRFGKGEGDAYADFIVHRLKPFIDSAYRTKSERKYTLIAGSSMGGLISFYAAHKYPGIFGGAGVFSPSFWLTPQLTQEILNKKSNIKPAYYFVCGEQESDKMVSDMKQVADALMKQGHKKVFVKTVKDGRHNESFWQKEMIDCFMWLQKNQIR
jgi:predicted alpha/beta superfamily hydrolase